ncbi:MAG: XRE family transcriptional regulator [Gemmatimonadota bacterium]|uniref:helix-turn-helix domain-containing protein n=1 Tax=Candidatus Palauibacter scopulicola TaxID=3056741 RepID=UPI002391C010|nr:XRE family transcriptional regulator [Candidatus Palauibacter scopulicola]MDE2663233.1 XRE family transcriptional regulator [Candidatus Palauibacter scopulicola]
MFGRRLRLARKRAGLSMRALAERMDPRITAQAISKYETGKMMPRSAVLVGLAKALDVSVDFLMSSQVEILDGLEFRKHSGTSARDRARAEAVLIDNLERYLTIEEILGIPPASDRFEGRRCGSVAEAEEIDGMADELRNAWDLGLDPVPNLCGLLDEKGIKVIEDDLPARISGLACQVLRGGKPVADAVLVSSRANVERKRLTLAHDLAHRMIRATGNPAIKLEAAMNRFAVAFLVPGRHLRERAGEGRRRITYCEIIRLKHTYGVSAAAMLVRLGQVGALTPAAVRRAFRTFARSWRKTEPEPLEGNEGFAAFEKPQRFRSLVCRAVGEELISPIRAATLLNESLDVVERQIAGPANR